MTEGYAPGDSARGASNRERILGDRGQPWPTGLGSRAPVTMVSMGLGSSCSSGGAPPSIDGINRGRTGSPRIGYHGAEEQGQIYQ